MEEQTVAAALITWTSRDRFGLVRQAPHVGCNDKGCLNSLIQQILSECLRHARLLARNKMAMFSLYFVRKNDNGHWEIGKEIWRKEVAILDSWSGERPLGRQTFKLRPECQGATEHVKIQGKNSRCKSLRLKRAWQI